MDWSKTYDEMNNAGHGFPVGSPDDDINEISGIGYLVKPASSDQDVSVYRDGDVYTIVGDSNGPWAVEVDGHSS